MKKIFTFLAFAFMTLTYAQAQNAPSPWTIGVAAGPAIPTGSFANKTPSYETYGSATTGIGAELTAGYRLCNHFGLVALAGDQVNSRDLSKFAALWPQNGATPGYLAARWNIFRLLVGGAYIQPLSKHGGPTLQIRLLGGVLKTKVPASSIYSDPIQNASALPMAWTFSYQADAGLKFKLARTLSLVTTAGYAAGNPIYKNPEGPGGERFHTGTVEVRAGLEWRI
jgi:hypothetical protein